MFSALLKYFGSGYNIKLGKMLIYDNTSCQYFSMTFLPYMLCLKKRKSLNVQLVQNLLHSPMSKIFGMSYLDFLIYVLT